MRVVKLIESSGLVVKTNQPACKSENQDQSLQKYVARSDDTVFDVMRERERDMLGQEMVSYPRSRQRIFFDPAFPSVPDFQELQ